MAGVSVLDLGAGFLSDSAAGGPGASSLTFRSTYEMRFKAIRDFGIAYDLMRGASNEPTPCMGSDRVSRGGAISKLELIKMWYGSTLTPLRPMYSWAIPSEQALQLLFRETLLENRNVVEIGAGSGYWLSLLSRFNVDSVGFDSDIESKFTKDSNGEIWPFVDIYSGGPAMLANGAYSDRLLLLCYPPPGSSMALEAVSNFGGDVIAYIGPVDLEHRPCGGPEMLHETNVPRNPCGVDVATPDFFQKLRAEWTWKSSAELKSHFFGHDYLVILSRKQQRPTLEKLRADPHLSQKPRWRRKADPETNIQRFLAKKWGQFEREFVKYAKVHGLDYNPDRDSPFRVPVQDPDLGSEHGSAGQVVSASTAEAAKDESELDVGDGKDWKVSLELLVRKSPEKGPGECLDVLKEKFPDLTRDQVKHARQRVLKQILPK